MSSTPWPPAARAACRKAAIFSFVVIAEDSFYLFENVWSKKQEAGPAQNRRTRFLF